MAHKLTKTKAKKILSDGTVRGKPLTSKQRKFFGAVAGGQKPYKSTSKHPKSRKKANKAIKVAKKVPAGMHKMPGGRLMKDSEMKKKVKKTLHLTKY